MSGDLTETARRPDVLLVVFDDMGFADLGCYGSSIRTPNIDALAAEGLRHNRFDVTPLCSPTRASLLTGRNPHAVGMGTIVQFSSEHPGYSGEIPASAAMLPQLLKGAGYSSGLFGKWHLSPNAESGPGGPYGRWPLACGFDRFFGFLSGRVHQFRPELVQDNTYVDLASYGGRHVSELIVDEAIRFIGDHAYARGDDPYFAMLSFGAVHSPHHAPAEFLRANRGMFGHGWDEERRRRFARQIELGILPADTPLPETDPNIPTWDSLSTDEKAVAERLMEAYAGHLEHADAELGRVLDALQRLGRAQDTLVIVMSDNGATNAGRALGTLSEEANLNDSPRPQPAADLNRIGGPDYYNQYPAGWGQASNTPFRRYKHTVHNGGTRSPLIVRGPFVSHRTAPVTTTAFVTDLVPTILEYAGTAAPESVNGVDQQPLHGRSLATEWSGTRSLPERAAQYFEVAGHRAMLAGDWKAVTFHPRGLPLEEDEWELYNVTSDPAESRDLSAHEPEKLRELIALWWSEAEKHQVLPMGGSGKAGLYRENPRRTRWVFTPEMTSVPQAAAPEISGHSFTITVDLRAPLGGSEGVLMAMGDVFGGVSVYAKESRLHVALNALGEVTTVSLNAPARDAGQVTAAFRIEPDHSGTILLTCDGTDEVASAPVAWVPHLRFFMGTAQCGRDQNAPVTSDYTGAFPFTGMIDTAVVEIHPRSRTGADAHALLRGLMTE